MANLFVSEGRCQFCHRTSKHLAHMVAGDSGLICSECIHACARLLQQSEHAPAVPDHAEPDGRHAFQLLTRHFAPMRPHEVLATSRTYPVRQQADLQRALDDLLGARRVPENFIGIRTEYRHQAVDFSKLLEQGHSPKSRPHSSKTSISEEEKRSVA